LKVPFLSLEGLKGWCKPGDLHAQSEADMSCTGEVNSIYFLADCDVNFLGHMQAEVRFWAAQWTNKVLTK